jgi:hypothetical protein
MFKLQFLFSHLVLISLTVYRVYLHVPIQFKNLQVYTIIRVVFQLSDEIPCISAVVVALLAEVCFF